MKAGSDFPNLNAKVPDGRRADGSNYKVMIVDDSIFVRKQLSQILSSEEYEVVGMAGDGEEAIEMYKVFYPSVDIVTMDITMPKMDGITALEKLIEFDKNARIIMVSALGKQELVKKSLLMGAKNYIVKPLDRKKVLERILAVVSK